MKKILALSTLTLALAACGQTATTQTPAQPSSIFTTAPAGPAYPDTQAAYEALALNTLGTQAVSQQVYLNVLPVAKTDDSVRAYLKSTFQAPVVCTLDWGDGSAPVSFDSPSTTRIDTRDHAYSVFGTYVITAKCMNNGMVVGSQTVTVRAGKKAPSVNTVITFDAPPAPSGQYNLNSSYQESGFNFVNTSPNYPYVIQFDKNYTENKQTYNFGDSQGLYSYSFDNSVTMTATDNKPFTLKSLDARCIFHDQVCDFDVTGYKADGSTVTARTQEVIDAGSTLTLGANWTGLTRVTFGTAGDQARVLIDNVSVSR